MASQEYQQQQTINIQRKRTLQNDSDSEDEFQKQVSLGGDIYKLRGMKTAK